MIDEKNLSPKYRLIAVKNSTITVITQGNDRKYIWERKKKFDKANEKRLNPNAIKFFVQRRADIESEE